MEISRPRLNAWLKSRRDWNVEINGNQDNTAMGAKIVNPIPASYILANSRTESHKPKLHTSFLQAIASCHNNDSQRMREGMESIKSKAEIN